MIIEREREEGNAIEAAKNVVWKKQEGEWYEWKNR